MIADPRTGQDSLDGALKTAAVGLLALLVLLLLPAADTPASTYYTCRLQDGRILMRETPCPRGAQTLSARPVEERPEPDAEEPADAEAPPAAPGEGEPPASTTGDQLVKDEAFVDPSFDPGILKLMMLRARLMKVVSSLHSLKTSVMMHYAERGDWPSGAADMGLDPETMHNDEITAVHFGKDGSILAELSSSFGEGKRIGFHPRWTLGGAELDWECVANFPEEVFTGMGAPPCKSRIIDAPSR